MFQFHMIKNLFTRRNLLIVLAGIAIVFIGARSYYAYAKGPQYETVEVKKTTITQHVTASGEIESENEVKLNFPVSGKLAYLAVKKNDRVKKGSYIGSLDKRALQKQFEETLRSYSKERNDFEQTWRVTYNGTSDPSTALNDSVRRILEKNQWDLDKAVLDVELADLSKQYADLFSPIDGAVTEVNTHEGTSIVAGTTAIVTIGDLFAPYFSANVGESDIANVAVGQEATVTLDAFESKKFTGKITEIDYAATVSGNGGKTYRVKIALDDLDKIKLDMSGDAEILTASHENALVLPRTVIQERSGTQYVDVVEAKQVRQKEVTLGMKGTGGVIEVLSGLSGNEKVVVPEPK